MTPALREWCKTAFYCWLTFGENFSTSIVGMVRWIQTSVHDVIAE